MWRQDLLALKCTFPASEGITDKGEEEFGAGPKAISYPVLAGERRPELEPTRVTVGARYVNCPEIIMTSANSYHIGCLLVLILVTNTRNNAGLFHAVLS